MLPQIPRAAVLLSLGLLAAACGGKSDDSGRWIGQTYLLEIPPANWSEPRGIGGDIGGFVPQFLFTVNRGSSQNLAVTVGTAKGGAQDPCNPTADVSMSGAQYPKSQILAPSFPLHIVDTNQMPTVVVDATVHGFSFNDILPAGDAKAKSGQVTATIDAGEVYRLFRLIPNPTKDSVCQALASAGAPCAACAHNGQPYCLTIKAVQVAGTPATAAVKPVTAGSVPASCSTP